MISSLLSSFFRTAAAPPPPLPNPVTKYSHWYHGTQHGFHGDDEEPDEDPGGQLQPPDRQVMDYGTYASEHWNTDLGVHFTSRHSTAQQFAGHGGNPESRIAHCRLHLGNPRHYRSEHQMTREAIDWAHDNGFHYLPKEHRDDPDLDEHLDNYGDFHDFPKLSEEDSSRLGHIYDVEDASKDLLGIDRKGRSHPPGYEEMYLANHPEREDITEGFKKHLESQGHDGVTYGNEHEMPYGHTCAIAFHPHQIHMDRWEWMHDDHPRHDPERSGHREVQREKLVAPNYTPSEGHHWVNDLGEKVGMLTRFLAEQLYRQPKPEREGAPEGASDDERLEHYDRGRAKEQRWTHEVRRAISRGDLHPQEAWNNGYKGEGHDERDNGARYHDTDRHNLAWEPLPHTLYHVTTNKAGVLNDSTLKSRKELGQKGGVGLGGGDDDTISFTDDPGVAHDIHRALHEYHQVVTGKKTVQHMLDEAREQGFEHHVVGGNYGGGSDWKSGDRYPHGLSEGLKGRRIIQGLGVKTRDEAKAVHPDAEPVESMDHWDAPKGRIYHGFSVPMDDDEKRDWASSHYKYHAALREHFGDKRMDPGFIFNDPKGFADTHPSQFAIIRAHPKPGAMGYRVSALGEWRSADGSSIHIGGLEPSHGMTHQASEETPPHHAGPHRAEAHLAAPYPSQPQPAKPHRAKQGQQYLPNPYHHGEYEDTWFHGTKKEFEGDPAPAMHGHDAPSKGMGGVQTNRLMGVHFTPLHNVAHGFAGDFGRGRIYHAKLKMTNPVHFEDEDHLLQHVWRWGSANHEGFHDEETNSLLRWNYGHDSHTIDQHDRDFARDTDKWRYDVHSRMERAIQFHPQQHDIVKGYLQHLRDSGHDGITYGNNVEGPRYHHCAIAFDPSQIEITHVDKMHPKGDVHPAWPGKTQDEWTRRDPGEVEHHHIRSIHGEPPELLHEIERYHNRGLTREHPDWYRKRGYNTGRGDFTFTAAKQRIPVWRGIHLDDDPEAFEGAVRRAFDHRQPVGSHWSSDPEVAEAYAGGLLRRHFEGAGIVLHGEVDPQHVVPHEEVPPQAYALGPDAFEKEVYIRPGAPVHVHKTTVHWHGGGGPDEEGLETDEWHDHADERHDPPLRMHAVRSDYCQGCDRETETNGNSGLCSHCGYPKYTWRDQGEMAAEEYWARHHPTQLPSLDEGPNPYKGMSGYDERFPTHAPYEPARPFQQPQDIYGNPMPAERDTKELVDRKRPSFMSRVPKTKPFDVMRLRQSESVYQREHAWLPRNRGVFGPGKGSVDPRLFDKHEKMHPYVHQVIMDRLDRALDDDYPDWRNWCRVYLAGSEASEWWGGNDFDTLIGVHYERFRKAHPEQADLTDEEISQHLTSMFRADFNDEDWIAPWDGQTWHLTAYSNPASYDIRNIKPYAAYRMNDDEWIVRSPRVGPDWGPEHFDESMWDEAEAYLKAVEAIERYPDARERARRGAALYEALHGGRKQAFGPHGLGWRDPANTVWKFLEYHPDEPVVKLVQWARDNAKVQAVAA